jgi:hypothetical protein
MHPTRTDILLHIHGAGRLSPNAYSKAAGETLSATTYHFDKLLAYGAIELVGTGGRGGGIEHFYALSPDSPVVRFLLESELPKAEPTPDLDGSSLGQLGADWRRTSLSIAPVLADAEAKQEVEAILRETKARLEATDAAARSRLQGSSRQPTTVHVALTAFEAG